MIVDSYNGQHGIMQTLEEDPRLIPWALHKLSEIALQSTKTQKTTANPALRETTQNAATMLQNLTQNLHPLKTLAYISPIVELLQSDQFQIRIACIEIIGKLIIRVQELKQQNPDYQLERDVSEKLKILNRIIYVRKSDTTIKVRQSALKQMQLFAQHNTYLEILNVPFDDIVDYTFEVINLTKDESTDVRKDAVNTLLEMTKHLQRLIQKNMLNHQYGLELHIYTLKQQLKLKFNQFERTAIQSPDNDSDIAQQFKKTQVCQLLCNQIGQLRDDLKRLYNPHDDDRFESDQYEKFMKVLGGIANAFTDLMFTTGLNDLKAMIKTFQFYVDEYCELMPPLTRLLSLVYHKNLSVRNTILDFFKKNFLSSKDQNINYARLVKQLSCATLQDVSIIENCISLSRKQISTKLTEVAKNEFVKCQDQKSLCLLRMLCGKADWVNYQSAVQNNIQALNTNAERANDHVISLLPEVCQLYTPESKSDWLIKFALHTLLTQPNNSYGCSPLSWFTAMEQVLNAIFQLSQFSKPQTNPKSHQSVQHPHNNPIGLIESILNRVNSLALKSHSKMNLCKMIFVSGHLCLKLKMLGDNYYEEYQNQQGNSLHVQHEEGDQSLRSSQEQNLVFDQQMMDQEDNEANLQEVKDWLQNVFDKHLIQSSKLNLVLQHCQDTIKKVEKRLSEYLKTKLNQKISLKEEPQNSFTISIHESIVIQCLCKMMCVSSIVFIQNLPQVLALASNCYELPSPSFKQSLILCFGDLIKQAQNQHDSKYEEAIKNALRNLLSDPCPIVRKECFFTVQKLILQKVILAKESIMVDIYLLIDDPELKPAIEQFLSDLKDQKDEIKIGNLYFSTLQRLNECGGNALERPKVEALIRRVFTYTYNSGSQNNQDKLSNKSDEKYQQLIDLLLQKLKPPHKQDINICFTLTLIPWFTSQCSVKSFLALYKNSSLLLKAISNEQSNKVKTLLEDDIHQNSNIKNTSTVSGCLIKVVEKLVFRKDCCKATSTREEIVKIQRKVDQLKTELLDKINSNASQVYNNLRRSGANRQSARQVPEVNYVIFDVDSPDQVVDVEMIQDNNDVIEID